MAKRRRLTGEAARERILDAAVEKLRAGGPHALTLATLAKELGVSHQAILHHFGSRDGLVAAVVKRALDNLQAELQGGLRTLSDHDRGGEALLDRAFEVLVDHGHGRLLGWLALGGEAEELLAQDEKPLEIFARLAHAIRERDVPDAPPYRDTLFAVMLCSYVLLGVSVFEKGTVRAAGLEAEPQSAEFRRWFRDLVVAHLERPRG
jgi:AcrR family transcriptional regulator